MQNIPTLTTQEILHLFQDKISVDHPDPGHQLFHSSISATIAHELFDLTFENITIRPEFSLNISRFIIKKPFALEVAFPVETVGFTFAFQGNSIFHIPFFQKPVTYSENSFTIFRCSPHIGVQELEPGQLTTINIHFSRQAFTDLVSSYAQELKVELSELFDGEYYLKMDFFRPSVKSVLKELLEHDFRGLSRQFFIESKVFELLSSQTEQLFSSEAATNPTAASMKQCKHILEENYATPPSLIELAKQLGTNTFYLKRDFNQAFGTSPYAYLKSYRLNLARKLLSENNLSVKDAANAVGYESVGSFSNAFFQEFGLRPTSAKTIF